MQYEEGSFCIEPVIFGTNGGECCLPKGVLVTEKSVNEEFSIMGIIVDEIEDIIQDYYPGIMLLYFKPLYADGYLSLRNM